MPEGVAVHGGVVRGGARRPVVDWLVPLGAWMASTTRAARGSGRWWQFTSLAGTETLIMPPSVFCGCETRASSHAGGGYAHVADLLLARRADGVSAVRCGGCEDQPSDRDAPALHRALSPEAGARLQRTARARADMRGGVRRARGTRRERDMLRQRNSRLYRKYGFKGRRERKG